MSGTLEEKQFQGAHLWKEKKKHTEFQGLKFLQNLLQIIIRIK